MTGNSRLVDLKQLEHPTIVVMSELNYLQDYQQVVISAEAQI
jgi:hypothetical protein